MLVQVFCSFENIIRDYDEVDNYQGVIRKMDMAAMKAVQAGWEYPPCASFHFTIISYTLAYYKKSTTNMIHFILQRSKAKQNS